MLFILTGEVQLGKSRWLQKATEELSEKDIPIYGVLAPGIWVPSDGPHADKKGFEKLGIENVLLPENEVIPFATRKDLAEAAGTYNSTNQSAQANLTWYISDEAITCVNNHLVAIPKQAAKAQRPGLLVIDELGRLELLRDEGLTEALQLLDKGPTFSIPHALVVVRDALLDTAKERLLPYWNEIICISPDKAGQRALMEAFEK